MVETAPIVRLANNRDPSVPLEDDSETIPPTPRRALIAALAAAVRDGTASGDGDLVRLAARALVLVTAMASDDQGA
jgi:hypothetical protein